MSDPDCSITIERLPGQEYRLSYQPCGHRQGLSRIMVLEQLTTLFWGLYRAIQEQWENDPALRRNEDTQVHHYVFNLLERMMSAGYRRANDLEVHRVVLFADPQDSQACAFIRVTWKTPEGEDVVLDVQHQHCRFPQAIWNDLAVYRVV